MSEVLVATISFIIGPLVLLVATRALDRRNAARTAELTKAMEQAVGTNSREHGVNASLLVGLQSEMAAHRQEFAEYREEHSREHSLINQIITTR